MISAVHLAGHVEMVIEVVQTFEAILTEVAHQLCSLSWWTANISLVWSYRYGYLGYDTQCSIIAKEERMK